MTAAASQGQRKELLTKCEQVIEDLFEGSNCLEDPGQYQASLAELKAQLIGLANQDLNPFLQQPGLCPLCGLELTSVWKIHAKAGLRFGDDDPWCSNCITPLVKELNFMEECF